MIKNHFFVVVLLFITSSIHTSDIFNVIESNNIKQVRLLLKSKTSLDVRNNENQTVLHVAVLGKQNKIVKEILKSVIEVNALDCHGKTALDYAVEYGYTNIIVLLVKYKAKVTSMQNAQDVSEIVKQEHKNFWFKLGLKIALWIPIVLVAGSFLGAILAEELFGLSLTATISYWIVGATTALAVSFLIPWHLGIPLGFLWGFLMIEAGGLIASGLLFAMPLGLIVWGLGTGAVTMIRFRSEKYFL